MAKSKLVASTSNIPFPSNGAARTQTKDPPGLLDDWICRDDLAAEFGVSPRTLSRWTHALDGIPHAEIGGQCLYRRSSVAAWLASREKRPTRTKRAA